MIILLAIFSIIFVFTLYFVQSNKTIKFDLKVSEAILSRRSSRLTNIMLFFTNLGKGKSILFICFLLFAIPATGTTLPEVSGIGAFIAFISSNSLKVIAKRVRPEGNRLVEENNFSFPSAHALAAAALYGGIVLNASVFCDPLKIIMVILSLLFIFFIGISRIYLGVHFFTDVIGGWSFSGIISIILTLIFKS